MYWCQCDHGLMNHIQRISLSTNSQGLILPVQCCRNAVVSWQQFKLMGADKQRWKRNKQSLHANKTATVTEAHLHMSGCTCVEYLEPACVQGANRAHFLQYLTASHFQLHNSCIILYLNICADNGKNTSCICSHCQYLKDNWKYFSGRRSERLKKNHPVVRTNSRQGLPMRFTLQKSLKYRERRRDFHTDK